jgi:CheY-like chemotaxis protein
VVDDDPTTREVVTEMLEALDYTVETARDGAEALEKVRRHRPDVVLLDLTMPVMDGPRFLQACRAEMGCGDLPVIIMSGSSDTAVEVARRFRAQCVVKPLDVVPFLATVQESVGA